MFKDNKSVRRHKILEIKVFLNFFSLMMERSGSERPKNLRILRIRNSDQEESVSGSRMPDPYLCFSPLQLALGGLPWPEESTRRSEEDQLLSRVELRPQPPSSLLESRPRLFDPDSSPLVSRLRFRTDSSRSDSEADSLDPKLMDILQYRQIKILRITSCT